MASFNFLRNTNVYLVVDGNRYPLEVESISADQTLMENSFPVKTLHTQDMFEASTITKANPGNFEFTIHLIREDDYSVVFDKLIDYGTFDLYIEGDEHVFKLEKCVITNGGIQLNRSTILKIAISGQFSRLHTPESASTYSYPGTLVPRSNTQGTMNIVKYLSVTWGGSDYSSLVESANIELQNQLDWTPYTTVHSGLEASDVDSIMYPSDFTIKNRILAGNIRRYIPNGPAPDVQNFDTSTSLRLIAGEQVGGTVYGIDLNLDSITWTNRVTFEQIYVEDYSWRMNYNPAALSSAFTYIHN